MLFCPFLAQKFKYLISHTSKIWCNLCHETWKCYWDIFTDFQALWNLRLFQTYFFFFSNFSGNLGFPHGSSYGKSLLRKWVGLLYWCGFLEANDSSWKKMIDFRTAVVGSTYSLLSTCLYYLVFDTSSIYALLRTLTSNCQEWLL